LLRESGGITLFGLSHIWRSSLTCNNVTLVTVTHFNDKISLLKKSFFCTIFYIDLVMFQVAK